jgi:protease-4
MSPAAREADSRWIGELWQNYLGTVAANRQITPEQRSLAHRACWMACVRLTAIRRNMRWITNWLMRWAPAPNEKALTKQFGWSKEDKNYSAISMYDYTRKNRMTAVTRRGGLCQRRHHGRSGDPGNVGGDTTASQIRDARLDPKVKAIVLRVNSPGGSVSASEVIRAELAAARRRQTGRGLHGRNGGSGGYWISTPANYIVANPSTLTGSIGIFGVINTVENSLDSLGVHTDGVATSPLADVGDQIPAAGSVRDDAAQH